jgi:hypothetical protein
VTIVVWNVADNHFVEPVTASMQQICALGSQFKLNIKVVSWVIKSQPELWPNAPRLNRVGAFSLSEHIAWSAVLIFWSTFGAFLPALVNVDA